MILMMKPIIIPMKNPLENEFHFRQIINNSNYANKAYYSFRNKTQHKRSMMMLNKCNEIDRQSVHFRAKRNKNIVD